VPAISCELTFPTSCAGKLLIPKFFRPPERGRRTGQFYAPIPPNHRKEKLAALEAAGVPARYQTELSSKKLVNW